MVHLPKMKCSFQNVTPQAPANWWPFKSNVVDKTPGVSISKVVVWHKNNMANLVGSVLVVVHVVDAFVVIVVFIVILVVVAFMLTDIVLLIGDVAAVVVRIETIFEWLSEAIVTMLAKHIATNIKSQMKILQV